MSVGKYKFYKKQGLVDSIKDYPLPLLPQLPIFTY
ncbi:MAG: hypothetical protein ACI8SC_001185, partial [Colwellia sp.]